MEQDDGEWSGNTDVYNDEDERDHVFSVLDSFRQYRRRTHYNATHSRRQAFYALPTLTWTRLAAPPISYLDTLSAVDDAVDTNADLAEAILESALQNFGLGPSTDQDSQDVDGERQEAWHGKARALDLDKARSTLHQLARDWSVAGAAERDACYGPVFADLRQHLPLPSDQAGDHSAPPSVLVPGAGLGRLVFDLCHTGYAVEGNEISYHQLFASSFILNHTRAANAHTLHPYATTFSNHLDRADQLRSVRVPDVCPAESVSEVGTMSMTAGDFCDVYGPHGDETTQYEAAFDAIATVFFIDTAPDFTRYIETVHHCLRRGGIWSNVGPLLWHFDGGKKTSESADGGGHTLKHGTSSTANKIGSNGSFELAADEVLLLLQQSGFEILKTKHNEDGTGYMGNELSMLRSVYRPHHWVARKT